VGSGAKSYITNGLLNNGDRFTNSSYIRRPFLIYDFAPRSHLNFLILYMRKILFSFLLVICPENLAGSWQQHVTSPPEVRKVAAFPLSVRSVRWRPGAVAANRPRLSPSRSERQKIFSQSPNF
jgi:hypothetical protein